MLLVRELKEFRNADLFAGLTFKFNHEILFLINYVDKRTIISNVPKTVRYFEIHSIFLKL